MLGNGKAYCWGVNGSFQLGTGVLHERDSLPQPVASESSFSAITVAETHSCAITTAGKAYCWGTSTFGALGNAATIQSDVPLAVDGGFRFTAIQTTDAFTCALTAAGAAYCWGENAWGQLGRDTTDARTPIAVSGNHVFTAIAVGGNDACGIVGGGDMYCWGDNGTGLLGTGDTATGKHPIPALIPGALHFKSVAIAGANVCALTTTGIAYCWGHNVYGQVGDGTRSPAYAPAAVETNLLFSAVSAGMRHMCAVSDTGELYCWGFNGSAQLAQGTAATSLCLTGPSTTAPCSLRPLPSAEGHIFRAVTAGAAQTCAVERNGGGAFCWGANDQGQLGLGTITDTVLTPTRLGDP